MTTRPSYSSIDFTTPTSLSHVWNWLTQPGESVSGSTNQRQARLIAILMLTLTLLPVVGALWYPPLLIIAGVIALTYALSRTRYYKIAGMLALLTLSLPSFMAFAAMTPTSPQTEMFFAVSWLILPVILSSLIFSIRSTVLLAALHMIVILTLTLIGQLPWMDVLSAASFPLVISTAMIASYAIRDRYIVRSQFDELRQMQRALQKANQNLEAANREVKDFAYIVAHDLRTPLVNIIGFMDEIRYVLAEITPPLHEKLSTLEESERERLKMLFYEDLPESIDFVDTSTNKMEHLIEQILELSSMGQRELQISRVQVTPMVQQMIDTRTYELDRRNAWAIVKDLPDVTADPVALEQVINNLIDNAVKYLDPARSGVIEISGERTKDETIYHVRDNGYGIRAEDREKVFQLFRRANNPGNVRGKGMGLAYVQALVHRHGGRVWFDSTYGAGSIFSFSIPHQINEE